MFDKVTITPIEEYAPGHWKIVIRKDMVETEFKVGPEVEVWVQTILKSLHDGLSA